MFTGLIEELGHVIAREASGSGMLLHIGANKVLEGIKIGDSISTNGVCLTVVGFNRTSFWSDVMPQTARQTNLGSLGGATGSRVNLERALRLGDRLGGHLVSGHVDGVGKVLRISDENNARWYTISASHEVMQYVIERGSIAIDGISLTVAQVSSIDDQNPLGLHSFKVSIIPHTLAETSLKYNRQGDLVNLECDMFAKYAARFLNMQPRSSKTINLDFLQANGFLD